MSQQELLILVCQRLESLGIDYMVTGSVASSLHGEPRASHDIDLVIALNAKDVTKFCQSFSPPDFFLQKESVEEALRGSKQVNLLHLAEGEKVDFWLLTDEPFDQCRFSRKITKQVFGRSIEVSSPEDTIIAKLRWAKMMGGSQKQLLDATGVLETQGALLDFEYIRRWVIALGLEEMWKQIEPKA